MSKRGNIRSNISTSKSVLKMIALKWCTPVLSNKSAYIAIAASKYMHPRKGI